MFHCLPVLSWHQQRIVQGTGTADRTSPLQDEEQEFVEGSRQVVQEWQSFRSDGGGFGHLGDPVADAWVSFTIYNRWDATHRGYPLTWYSRWERTHRKKALKRKEQEQFRGLEQVDVVTVIQNEELPI